RPARRGRAPRSGARNGPTRPCPRSPGSPGRASRGGQLVDVGVDERELSVLVELGLHDPLGDPDCEDPDLLPELTPGPLPLGLDLGAPRLDDAVGLLLSITLEVLPDLFGGLPRFSDDPVRLVTGGRQPGPVRLEQALGLRSGLFRLLDVALDAFGAILEHLRDALE